MNMKQMKQRVNASTFPHRKLSKTLKTIEQSFRVVNKTLNYNQRKGK